MSMRDVVRRQHPYHKHAEEEPSDGCDKNGNGRRHVQQLSVQHPNPAGKQKHANSINCDSDQAQEYP